MPMRFQDGEAIMTNTTLKIRSVTRDAFRLLLVEIFVCG
jgi:hypothetical protein